MMCQRIGMPPISTSGFGRNSVSSRILVPLPPHKMTAFMAIIPLTMVPPNLNEEGAERSFYAFLLFFSVPGMVSIGGTLRTFINKTCSLWVMSGKKASIQELISTAAEIRKSIVRMIGRAKASHIGGALSAADILAALYFRVLSIDPKSPKGEERDIFILSKGHCCSAI